MRKYLKAFYSTLRFWGYDPRACIFNIKGLPYYFKDYYQIKNQKGIDDKFFFGKRFPILNERFAEAGTMSGDYFHQDLLVARKIYQNNPQKHVDIGSRIDGFVAHVAVFRQIEIIDIRGQKSRVNNIIFRQADLMKLPVDMINYADSISALHSLEHFGLGRYGDPIDYYGYLKALDNIYLMLQPKGKFYFSVPIGRQRIEFNAHRVFAVKYLFDLFEGKYSIDSFSYVNDEGNLIENPELTEEAINLNFGCNHGCGIFELTKNIIANDKK